MSASEIERTLVRLAHEIVEKNNGTDNLGLVGIKRRGIPIAQRLAKIIERIERQARPCRHPRHHALSRSPLSTVGVNPESPRVRWSANITGKRHRLADDVLYTGRTTRAALDALFDHGRPNASNCSSSSIVDTVNSPSKLVRRTLRPDHRSRDHRSQIPGDRPDGKSPAGRTRSPVDQK